MISSMNTMPIDDELVTDVLEELWAVVEHSQEDIDLQNHYFRAQALVRKSSQWGYKNQYLLVTN